MGTGNGVKPLFTAKQQHGGSVEADRVSSIEDMGEVEQFSSEKLDEFKIIYPKMANSDVLNTYRALRTQLVKGGKSKNFLCLVTSIASQGGATHIAMNLAAAFSLDKMKTSLLIDANLYSPKLEDLIVGDAELGLTDYLGNARLGLDIKDIVYATGIPRLRVVPIGGNSEAAAEYFSSEKMRAFSTEIRDRYNDRFIFVDAPPILEASETQILVDIADMVVLVVPHGKATKEQIQEAIEMIGQEKLVGLIYNN